MGAIAAGAAFLALVALGVAWSVIEDMAENASNNDMFPPPERPTHD